MEQAPKMPGHGKCAILRSGLRFSSNVKATYIGTAIFPKPSMQIFFGHCTASMTARTILAVPFPAAMIGSRPSIAPLMQ